MEKDLGTATVLHVFKANGEHVVRPAIMSDDGLTIKVYRRECETADEAEEIAISLFRAIEGGYGPSKYDEYITY